MKTSVLVSHVGPNGENRTRKRRRGLPDYSLCPILLCKIHARVGLGRGKTLLLGGAQERDSGAAPNNARRGPDSGDAEKKETLVLRAWNIRRRHVLKVS